MVKWMLLILISMISLNAFANGPGGGDGGGRPGIKATARSGGNMLRPGGGDGGGPK